ncbi:MAG: metal ABC transporter solute-binding protein, Zn/Mn family [Desulfovibrionales bacterium]
MKRIALAFLILVVLTGEAKGEPFQVTVSIPPQKYFLERIAGELVTVEIMLPPGASPATYEPRPRQMAALSKSRAYFAIGVPFEAAWLPRFAAANPSMSIVHTDQGIEKAPITEQADHEHADGNGTPSGGAHSGEDQVLDPHIWLSPVLVKKIAVTIRDALQEIDPANRSAYAASCDSFLLELDELHKEITSLFSRFSSQKRTFLVFHPSWGYFAQDYQLEQIAIEVSGAEPSPREMAELIETAGEKKIQAVFVQPQFSKQSAQTIAGSIGARVLVADPLASNWSGNLKDVAQRFKESLQ